ncbi:YciI family protein [Plantactinospora sp. GCM10030261]|uniref:YciI family protein n=1 Tax=Plantactinospora sp. GCM10030261 TaxID=3273420 RepID=UPI003605C094
MICVELTFTDDPARLAVRPAHRDQVAALHERGDLLLAGPWADDSGALLIFDVDRDRLTEIMAADPYYETPGVTVASIRRWRPLQEVPEPR